MFHYVDDLDRFVHQNQVYKLDESNWRHLDYHFRLHIVYKMDDAKQEMSKSMLKKKIVLFLLLEVNLNLLVQMYFSLN